jgi:hypothetical protein
MTEQNEEHFEVIDANRAKDSEKKNYTPLSHDLFIEKSLKNISLKLKKIIYFLQKK